MDRREILKMVLAGTASPTLLPWLFHSRSQKGRLLDAESVSDGRIQVPKPRKCPVCKKDDYLFGETTMIETTASYPTSNDRTYAVAGIMYFHQDGIRCYEECIEFKQLRHHKKHKRIKPSEYDKKVL